jgi:hypothetical protein
MASLARFHISDDAGLADMCAARNFASGAIFQLLI